MEVLAWPVSTLGGYSGLAVHLCNVPGWLCSQTVLLFTSSAQGGAGCAARVTQPRCAVSAPVTDLLPYHGHSPRHFGCRSSNSVLLFLPREWEGTGLEVRALLRVQLPKGGPQGRAAFSRDCLLLFLNKS